MVISWMIFCVLLLLSTGQKNLHLHRPSCLSANCMGDPYDIPSNLPPTFSSRTCSRALSNVDTSQRSISSQSRWSTRRTHPSCFADLHCLDVRLQRSQYLYWSFECYFCCHCCAPTPRTGCHNLHPMNHCYSVGEAAIYAPLSTREYLRSSSPHSSI